MVLSIGFAVDSSAPDRDDCRLEYSLYNQYYRYGAYHYYKYYLYVMIPVCILGISNIIWCMCFFTFHSLMAAVIILALQSLLSAAIFIMLIKKIAYP